MGQKNQRGGSPGKRQKDFVLAMRDQDDHERQPERNGRRWMQQEGRNRDPAAAQYRRRAVSPMARNTNGRARARGVGSYSIESTWGPLMVAPNETMAATSREGPIANPGIPP